MATEWPRGGGRCTFRVSRHRVPPLGLWPLSKSYGSWDHPILGKWERNGFRRGAQLSRRISDRTARPNMPQTKPLAFGDMFGAGGYGRGGGSGHALPKGPPWASVPEVGTTVPGTTLS